MPNDPCGLRIERLGITSYSAGLARQKQRHAEVVAGLSSTIITTQHHPTITIGKRALRQDLLSDQSQLDREAIDLVQTQRGGRATAHNPGQLVLYPILDKKWMKGGPRGYVQAIEQAVVETLDEFGISSTVLPSLPGVWVGRSKICAIGIQVSQRVSCHGLALNINNDLSIFNHIIPCGIPNHGVTRIADLLVTPPPLEEVREMLLGNLIDKLQSEQPPRACIGHSNSV